METKIPTHDEICATFAEVRDRIAQRDLCLDATIDDYPIGRRECQRALKTSQQWAL